MSDSAEPYEAMPVHDERVPEEVYAQFVEQMPQPCVEVVVEDEPGVLLAKRAIEPRIWFWPGGRLYKGERLEAAARRVAGEELAIEVRLLDRLGTYAHFWAESSVEGSPSRHTINVVFHATPVADEYEVALDDQHSAYRFVSAVEPGLHEYVRLYLRDNDLV
jgi:colanic acid biosynthesis protein WcaH